MKFSLHKFALLSSTLIWGSSFVVMKYVTEAITVSYLLALRFTIGSLFLLALCYKQLKEITKKDIKIGIFIGVLLFLGFFV